MLSEADIRAAIADAVDRGDLAALGIETDFYDFGLDSLDHAQILMRVEDLYGLHVADADFPACRSIAAIAAYSRQSADP
ncbi:acyl carrier protein [Stella humosa]|uniref:Acyl carrier protein n=1 Tax=Stella humosa TaxID=94 RepID=A0A3N1KWJ8_9PROT|nr:acyl carrier protein [Stella humosa]ROP83189.1 acyl carrier protein [Stella humosa]BBK30032.1 hypothetical protein STHU_06660 [Stella humosa]